MKITKDTIALGMIAFSFWGFLGSEAFGLMHSGISATLASGVPFAALTPTVLQTVGLAVAGHIGTMEFNYWAVGQIYMLLVWMLFGYGILRIFGRLKPILIIGGFGAAIFTMLPYITAIPEPYATLSSTAGNGFLFMAIVGWIYSLIETRADGDMMNVLSGWGGLLVGGIMGALFQMDTMIGGISSFNWAFIFAAAVLSLMGFGGILVTETGPIVQAKKEQAIPEKH
ncbi:MAG: hypothetical protein ABSB71_12700 [Candidatus Bathyarchaeia archaeon]|jgi:hypothetical protein